jgi:hypothetical protein
MTAERGFMERFRNTVCTVYIDLNILIDNAKKIFCLMKFLSDYEETIILKKKLINWN